MSPITYTLALVLLAVFLLALGLVLWAFRTPRLPPAVAASEPARIMNVRDLVPAYSSATPQDPTAGLVRLAFRSHVAFQNDCSVVLLSWHQLTSAPLSEDQRLAQLCELYSRAIFESVFAAHFDSTNPRTDKVVLVQIAESFGKATAKRVHDMVAERGVVLSNLRSELSHAG